MSEFNYVRTRNRYFENLEKKYIGCCGVNCDSCMFSKKHNGKGLSCCDFEVKFPDEATELLKKWDKEHPIKTNRQKFIEVFGCEHTVTASTIWWNAEYEGGEDDDE